MSKQTHQTTSVNPWHKSALVAGLIICCMAACDNTDGADDEADTKTSGPDLQQVDVQKFALDKPGSTLCHPCSLSITCDGVDDNKPTCVDYGVAGSFCGVACSSDSDCPSIDGPRKYTCKSAKTVEGVDVKACVPEQKAGDPGDFGVCRCSPWAASKALSTACAVESADGKSLCPGNRVCTGGGLTECQGDYEPATEVCDHLDNDCDGEFNEATCDDDSPCTSEYCDPAKGCVFTAIAAECDDGLTCTVKDACKQGKCTGKARVCADDNPCTKDSCDPDSGCVHAATDAAPCDDGSPCTVGDACKGDVCTPGAAKDCDDGVKCTEDLCHQASGTCMQAADDKLCDDGDDATTDTCDEKKGCVNLPAGATGA